MAIVSRSMCGLLASIGTASAATQQHIGSWVLTCPSEIPRSAPCLLRSNHRLLDKGAITGDLEIQAIGKSLVPVIALRGVPSEIMLAASLASQTVASVQFDGRPKQVLVCAPSETAYICAPRDEAARKLAADLPMARSVTVRVSITVTGLKPQAIRPQPFALTGTAAALARLRALGAPQIAPAALSGQSPGRLAAVADKALKAAGYANGLSDLQTLLTKYRGK